MAVITGLNLYPIKSAAAVTVMEAWVSREGLTGDRRYMLARPDGSFVTARTHPRIQSIVVKPVAGGLDLQYGDERLAVRHQQFGLQPVTTFVWDDQFTAWSTHSEYDAWFSQILEQPVQLLWVGEQSGRYRDKLGIAVSFADGYPLLLISEASLTDLNLRADARQEMSQFRTNLVVTGTRPFEEDGWRRIRIGDVEFLVAKPCSRCVMTTIEPDSEHFNRMKEPLATLLRYRRGEDGDVYFGQNLVPLNEGHIRLDDEVEVLEYASAPIYPDAAPRRRTLRCVAREPLARDMDTYWLEATDGKPLADYQPGQHLPVALDIEGRRHLRYYTLSSSPTRPGRYGISVKRQPDGRVSNWLAEALQPGSTLLAHAPTGDFILKPAERYLLLSAGSGITPMLSIVRALADRKQLKDLVFLHVCRTEADIPARAELEQLAADHPGLTLEFVLTRPARGEGGRLILAQLAAIPALPQRRVYLCGPDGFMQQARSWLLALGVPVGMLRQEYFASPQTETVSRETLSVNIRIGEREFVGNNRQDLLTQAEGQGVSLPWSCRAGICGSCKQTLKSGEVDQPEAPALSAAERKAGVILTCCCVPLSDVEFNYP
ncbi:hybrid-cluster NAD(P)-dependent oxidoreductase [Oceanisphaera arctica]|uniref:Flavodoxin n=1 Tax=Oceanisphaera arctica TaxID=641510 RepID=A0A2P5TPG8_9GAMM|nr:hybrid-cluster NAD(P)-dependent oxidoreductase [Oceanisphaera arctica]PPL17539.1 flavodoxin [Oceanisphaera arctica]GHA16422.1 flavodoxin [Oceanisphaera arctica]